MNLEYLIIYICVTNVTRGLTAAATEDSTSPYGPWGCTFIILHRL